jgi:hypothetical protein
MKSKIDIFSFEKYFGLFIDLVEAKSKTKFISFPANRYTEENEGYKDEIYEKARNNLQFWKWGKNDIGTGKIIRKVISAIKLENIKNNLVDWRLTSKFEDKAKDDDKINDYEKAFFDFFHDLKTDQESFDIFIESFGKNYPLIAYLFFTKDKAQYMPISPNNFDTAFKKLGIVDFKTSYQCSWSNYTQYNKFLNQVKDLLISREIKDVSLLNAHSFVWIISGVEEELSKIGLSVDEKIKVIAKYQKLESKDKETVIKARIGQGIFREWLEKYWNKCSVTGCRKISVLIASHIKPWIDCNNEEAIDVYNGLLLTPNIDKLFDKGLISFSDDGVILISSELDDENLKTLGIKKDMRVNKIENEHLKYFDYHRTRIFKK